jgi:hypothetical protein
MEISSHHLYRFPAPRRVVWDVLAGVDAYRTWWPWLRRFDAVTLAEREVWSCTIRPPLPYAIRCRVELATVRAPALVVATLTGDIAGDARLELTEDGPDDPVTAVAVTSRLTARSLPARVVSRLLPAAAQRGHDWLFDTAAHQFGVAALGPLATGDAAPVPVAPRPPRRRGRSRPRRRGVRRTSP